HYGLSRRGRARHLLTGRGACDPSGVASRSQNRVLETAGFLFRTHAPEGCAGPLRPGKELVRRFPGTAGATDLPTLRSRLHDARLYQCPPFAAAPNGDRSNGPARPSRVDVAVRPILRVEGAAVPLAVPRLWRREPDHRADRLHG